MPTINMINLICMGTLVKSARQVCIVGLKDSVVSGSRVSTDVVLDHGLKANKVRRTPTQTEC